MQCYNHTNLVAENSNNTGNAVAGGIVGGDYANAKINVFNIRIIMIQTTGGASENFYIGGLSAGKYAGIICNGYNIANIKIENSEIERVGSIIGQRWDTELENCYYLKGSYSKGIGKLYNTTDTLEGIEELENLYDFPSVLEIVNTEGAFKVDTNNINNGYPILTW